MKDKNSNSKDFERSGLKKAKTKSNLTRKKVSLGVWSFENPVPAIQKGQKLRIETKMPAVIHWTDDEWKTTKDTPTSQNSQGRHYADLSGNKEEEKSILFTFYWPDAQHWENRDFEVQITDGYNNTIKPID